MRYDGPYITPWKAAEKRDAQAKMGTMALSSHERALKMHAHAHGVTIGGLFKLEVKDFYKLIAYDGSITKRGHGFKAWFLGKNGRYIAKRPIPLNIPMKIFKALRAIQAHDDDKLNRLFPPVNVHLKADARRNKKRKYQQVRTDTMRS